MALTKVSYSMITGATVNVLDYGAVGDGVANDQPAIQAAINAANTQGGGIVYFPVGTYLILTPLVGKSLVYLIGEVKGAFSTASESPPNVFIGGVQIKAGAAMAAMYSFVGTSASDTANIAIENIYFECSALATGGISIRKAVDVSLFRVQVHTATTAPFILGTAADTSTPMFFLYLDQCYANGTGGAATLFSICATQVHMTRCLSDNGAIAVALVGGSGDVLIDNCRFEGYSVKGIAIQDFGISYTIRGTTCVATPSSAAGVIGIEIDESQGFAEVSGCTIYGGSFASSIGINVLDSGAGIFANISNNYVIQCATALSYNASYGGAVIGNIFEALTSGTAVLLQNSTSKLSFIGNICRGITGATSVTALNNQSTNKTILFDNNQTSGTTTGIYFPTTTYGNVAIDSGQIQVSDYSGMATVATSATGILQANAGGSSCLVVVSGSSGSNRFTDLVAFFNGGIVVISSSTMSGAPAARTYTDGGGGLLLLAMASGSYSVSIFVLENFRT